MIKAIFILEIVGIVLFLEEEEMSILRRKRQQLLG